MGIKIISSCAEMHAHARATKREGKTIGVVPTMGALHEGHLSLVRFANEQTDETIVTIFVNPTQFAEGEDLDKYPRPLEDDLQKLGSLGVATVFAPSDDEMYPVGPGTTVVPPAVAQPLEGEFRPTHFSGVATVVLKLLNLTGADKAFFGQKDFQQVMVVKQMVTDLNVPAEIVACPIVREKDGLALSSRNAYLSDEERDVALALNQTLKHVKKMIKDGERDGHLLMAEMRQMLIDRGIFSIDYAVVADPRTLLACDEVSLPVVALIAAHVGTTRLIDNCLIELDS